MYTSDHPTDVARIQFHRFDEGCPLDSVITTLPHVAFKVRSLEQAIVDQRVILGPYEPIPGYRVAAIDANGVPIEFVETDMTDDELWSYADSQPVDSDLKDLDAAIPSQD